MAKCIECNKKEAEDNAPKELWQHLYCPHCWDWLGQCEPYDNLKVNRKEKIKISQTAEIREVFMPRDLMYNYQTIDE